jgi:hypothetical protein
MVPVPGAVPTGAPVPGEYEVGAVHGSIFFANASATGVYQLAVGMYVSEQSTQGAPGWALRKLLDPKDAMRDDYIYLKTEVVQVSTTAATTGLVVIEFPLLLPGSVLLGAGEALHCQAELITSASMGAATMDVYFFVRSKVILAT